MSGPHNIFVTGATGFIGSHFVREWQQSEHGRLFALVRAKPGMTQAQRLAAALETAKYAAGTSDRDPVATLEVVAGDVTKPLCGVTQETAARLRAGGMDVFWHFASDLRYEDGHQAFIHLTNVEGARHALDLAEAMGAKRFVYVSTAFVCGRTEGLISESLLPTDIAFSNGYEASKAEAERLVIDRCRVAGMAVTILRPSIVIGPRATKRSEGSETGLFSLVHAVMWIRSSQSGQLANLRVAACPEAEINFIAVDDVVADMISLARSGFGKQVIYHLTATTSISVAQCWDAISHVTGMDNVELARAGSFTPEPAERLIARRIGFFLNYINADHRFVRSLAPTRILNAMEFTDYVRNAKHLAAGEAAAPALAVMTP